MNDLKKYFDRNQDRWITKWMHYFEVYDLHFSRFRNQEVHILEIGVNQGGSLQMWKQYFGEKAKIYGVDIDYRCKNFEEENIEIFIGSQEDRSFLKALKERLPRIDILLDDGGHTMKQQIITFEEMFSHVSENGVYMCEDLHTSYWPTYGGGYKEADTFVEYSKNFVDYIHAWRSRENHSLGVSDFTMSAHSIHFYESIVVIEKKKMEKPKTRTTGTRSYNFDNPEDLQQALEKWQKEITHNPRNGAAFRSLADVLQEKENYADAIKYYEKSLELEENPGTYFGLGLAQSKLEKYQQACSCYYKAISLEDEYPFWNCLSLIYNALAKALIAQNKLSEAYKAYQKIIELEPENYGHYLELGQLQAKMKNYDDAIASYQKSIALKYHNFAAYRQMGDIYNVQGKSDMAIDAYQKAIKIRPESPGIVAKIEHLKRR